MLRLAVNHLSFVVLVKGYLSAIVRSGNCIDFPSHYDHPSDRRTLPNGLDFEKGFMFHFSRFNSDLSELKHQEYVSATATTSETYKAFFMRLMALVDLNKINADSYLQKVSSGSIYHTYNCNGSSVGFILNAFSSYGLSGNYGYMSSTNATWLQYDEGANPKFTNFTNSNVSSGDAVEWRIYY